VARKKDIQEKRGKFAKLLIDWLADATDSRTLNELAFHILGKKAVGNLSINLFFLS